MLKILIHKDDWGPRSPRSKTLVKLPVGSAVWFSSYHTPDVNPYRSGQIYVFQGMARDKDGNAVAVFGPLPADRREVEARMGLYLAEPIHGNIIQPELKQSPLPGGFQTPP